MYFGSTRFHLFVTFTVRNWEIDRGTDSSNEVFASSWRWNLNSTTTKEDWILRRAIDPWGKKLLRFWRQLLFFSWRVGFRGDEAIVVDDIADQSVG